MTDREKLREAINKMMEGANEKEMCLIYIAVREILRK